MANFFPRSSNWLPLKIAVILAVLGGVVTALVTYYFTPKYTRMGYMPIQPVAFSHEIHSKQLGMDCRYCHSFVEVAAHSNVPTTQVCMNCHAQVQKDNPKLAPLHESWRTGRPIEWVQVHKTPDYVYFNHAAHVNRGVSCVSCHGRVDKMPEVYHAESHSMAWCLDCHRAPETALRPVDQVTNLGWKPADQNVQAFIAQNGKPPGDENTDFNKVGELTQDQIGKTLRKKWHINPPDKNCAGCHR